MAVVRISIQGLSMDCEGTKEQCDALMEQALHAIGGMMQAIPATQQKRLSSPKKRGRPKSPPQS